MPCDMDICIHHLWAGGLRHDLCGVRTIAEDPYHKSFDEVILSIIGEDRPALIKADDFSRFGIKPDNAISFVYDGQNFYIRASSYKDDIRRMRSLLKTPQASFGF